MCQARKIKGFTLVELMFTVAIAAIVITVGIPMFTGMMDKNRLKGAAETLYADLQYARIASIKQNRPIRVSFNTAKGCYGLDDDLATACDCGASPAFCTVQGVQKVFSSDAFRGVTLAANFVNNDIVFDPVRGTLQDMEDNLRQATFKSSDGKDDINVQVSFVGQTRKCTRSSNLWGYEKCPANVASL